jgi:hypothetical protein
MFEALKQFLSGRKPKEVVLEREREIENLQHEFKNCVQSVQSGRQMIQSLSVSIESKRRHYHPVTVRSRTRVVQSPS